MAHGAWSMADAALLRALAGFKGVGRRFQRYGQDLPCRSAPGAVLVAR